jgi:hypothetical protein
MNKLYDVLFTPSNTDRNSILLRGELSFDAVEFIFHSDFNHGDIKVITSPEEFKNPSISEIVVEIEGEIEYFDVAFIEPYHMNKEREAKQVLRKMGYYIYEPLSIEQLKDQYPGITEEDYEAAIDRCFSTDFCNEFLNTMIAENYEELISEKTA